MVIIFLKLLILLIKVVTALFVLLCIYLVCLRFKTENKMPYGTGISTWYESDRTRKNLLYWLNAVTRKKKAMHVIKKYFKAKGEYMSSSQVETKVKGIIEQLLRDIATEYPSTQEYMKEIPKIFIQSDYWRFKKASKDFNATSYDVGTTGLNVSYILKYINAKTDGEKKEWISLIAQILFHENGHHQFKLKAGFHLIKKHSEQLIHHINEYYADLRAFEIMKLDTARATEIMKRKAALISTKNQFATYYTHPSHYCREQFVAQGAFNVYSILYAADMINLNKGAEYIKGEDIKLVTEKIGEFERKHPEITVEFELL